jgi:predicted transposase YbfD/YdcC
VGDLSLPDGDQIKRTNEIKIAAPLLQAIDIAGLVITADALLTQRELANTLVERGAHYHFTAKANQPTLEQDIAALFAARGAANFAEVSPPDHGRIETRRIWCSTRINEYVDFPHVGQVFLVEREVVKKKSNTRSIEVAVGVTSCTPEQASPATVLRDNRGHWAIENSCHYVCSTRPGTKTTAASEPATVPKTPPGCAASQSAYSTCTSSAATRSPQ